MSNFSARNIFANLKKEAKTLSLRTLRVYWTLVKIMVPVLILVKILQSLGAIYYLSLALSPVMELVGLPGDMGVVWSSAILVNIYTSMAVFFSIGMVEPLSVAQVTVLATMILLAHGLPVESAISKAAGLGWIYTLSLRVGGAFVLGLILHWSFSYFSMLQEPSQVLWRPEPQDESLISWAILQAQTLVLAFLIIACLVVMMRLLEYFKIEKLLHWLLTPFLKLLGIGKEAANITVIGMVMGLSFGGGLLIEQAKSGKVSKRNIFLSMSLLCLCHSIIEDTLLVLLLGADLVGVLWARLIFSFIFVMMLSRMYFLIDKEKPSLNK